MLCWKLFSDCGVHKKAYIKEEKRSMTKLIHALTLKKKKPAGLAGGSSLTAISLYHWQPLNGAYRRLTDANCYYLPVNGSFKSNVNWSDNWSSFNC